jgi:putative transposase
MTLSRGKRYSEDQIIKALNEIEAAASIANVARSHRITEQTLFGLRGRNGGMTKSKLVQLKSLQKENGRLRHVISELILDSAAVKELQKGKVVRQVAQSKVFYKRAPDTRDAYARLSG